MRLRETITTWAEEDAAVEYSIRCEQLGSRPLTVIRRRSRPEELSKDVPDACGAVWAVIRSKQISAAGRHVAVYLDGQINLEVGVELNAPLACRWPNRPLHLTGGAPQVLGVHVALLAHRQVSLSVRPLRLSLT
jgi:hypothetical protein